MNNPHALFCLAPTRPPQLEVRPIEAAEAARRRSAGCAARELHQSHRRQACGRLRQAPVVAARRGPLPAGARQRCRGDRAGGRAGRGRSPSPARSFSGSSRQGPAARTRRTSPCRANGCAPHRRAATPSRWAPCPTASRPCGWQWRVPAFRPQTARGRKVLVSGAAGGLGQLALQLLRHWGAVVTAVDLERNLDRCAGLGAAALVARESAAMARLPADFAAVLNFGKLGRRRAARAASRPRRTGLSRRPCIRCWEISTATAC